LGAHVRPGRLRESLRPGSGQGGEGETQRWTADPEELATLVTARTRAILICNPNNPTGARLEAPGLDAGRRVAERVGAVASAYEIYRGAEREADDTPSIWDCGYERAVVSSGLSKAYGLPGMCIGWVRGAPAP